MDRSLAFLLIAASFTSHCGGSPPPPPPVPPPREPAAPKPCQRDGAMVTIATGSQLNTNTTGSGMPVRVRIYQLKGEARFRSAQFEEMWQDDKAALQDDLLVVREQTAYPGGSERLWMELNPEARAVGVIALFRQPQAGSWYFIFPLEPLPAKPPCPPARPEISLWLDRMKIQDGTKVQAQRPQ